jgi:hypothetical protein
VLGLLTLIGGDTARFSTGAAALSVRKGDGGACATGSTCTAAAGAGAGAAPPSLQPQNEQKLPPGISTLSPQLLQKLVTGAASTGDCSSPGGGCSPVSAAGASRGVSALLRSAGTALATATAGEVAAL